MQPLQILIADNHDAGRRWVRAALEKQAEWTVCGEAKTAPETVAKTIELRPDVVLLDGELPGLSGVDVAREIYRIAPAVHVLTLANFTSGHARQHYDASARDATPKTEAGHTLVDVITTLVDKPTIDGDRARTHDEVTLEPGRAASVHDLATAALSSREREVLRYVADGKSNKEVGMMLSISTRTVETHRARLMRKLNLHSINQLIRYAIRHRIINA